MCYIYNRYQVDGEEKELKEAGEKPRKIISRVENMGP